MFAGRTPRKKSDDELTVKGLVNDYLNSKRKLLAAGELSKHTFSEQHHACRQMVEAFGEIQIVSELEPSGFAKLREGLSRTRGAVTLAIDVLRIRMVFKHAKD